MKKLLLVVLSLALLSAVPSKAIDVKPARTPIPARTVAPIWKTDSVKDLV